MCSVSSGDTKSILTKCQSYPPNDTYSPSALRSFSQLLPGLTITFSSLKFSQSRCELRLKLDTIHISLDLLSYSTAGWATLRPGAKTYLSNVTLYPPPFSSPRGSAFTTAPKLHCRMLLTLMYISTSPWWFCAMVASMKYGDPISCSRASFSEMIFTFSPATIFWTLASVRPATPITLDMAVMCALIGLPTRLERNQFARSRRFDSTFAYIMPATQSVAA
mmetsp:Transcript_28710/g.91623  ORF Transcript_28710/g.91623 Transcript_28710/m.91623 type:complete len:220 (-) Transcript_28710:1535-2194(-)